MISLKNELSKIEQGNSKITEEVFNALRFGNMAFEQFKQKHSITCKAIDLTQKKLLLEVIELVKSKFSNLNLECDNCNHSYKCVCNEMDLFSARIQPLLKDLLGE